MTVLFAITVLCWIVSGVAMTASLYNLYQAANNIRKSFPRSRNP